MTEHYYTQNPGAAHDEREIIFHALGEEFFCTTDAGVFSRDGLDMGTRILLEALPPICGRVLDLGCGWGPVGVVLGKKYPDSQIVMSDINARAVELAQRNLKKNAVKNAEAVQGEGLDHLEGPFDCILLNPPIRAGKAVIYALFDGAAAKLAPGGSLYVVIRKQQGAESAQKYLLERFAQVERIAREKGYWVLKCTKAEEAA